MTDEIFDLVGFVMASDYRLIVLNALDNRMNIPSNIAEEVNIKTNHVSNVLKELKDKKLVECLNEDAKKGRLYQVTDLGKEVIKRLE